MYHQNCALCTGAHSYPTIVLNDEKQKINFSITIGIDNSHKATNCHLNINSMSHMHEYKGVK
jgi:hypothetical protein